MSQLAVKLCFSLSSEHPLKKFEHEVTPQKRTSFPSFILIYREDKDCLPKGGSLSTLSFRMRLTILGLFLIENSSFHIANFYYANYVPLFSSGVI